MPQPDRLIVILGDQLTHSLVDATSSDIVLMAEVMGECSYVPHHQKKLVFVLSAMRHFAAELRGRGVRVEYVALDDPGNSGSLCGEVAGAVARLRPARVVVIAPGEWRVLQDMRGWQDACGVPVEIGDDPRFLCHPREFRAWAEGRQALRMEFFYREMRRRYGVLLEGDGTPAGGAWNFDADNRKALPKGLVIPPVPRFAPDAITREVMALVRARFGDHFGDVEGFAMPVCAADAQAAAEDFLARRLPRFGDWQDAMARGQASLFHSLISAALNAGLLEPLAIVRAAERAWREGRAPLNAVEGFIRQILGWREFIRGIYWLKMPGYAEVNALAATRRLPGFYWSGETRMACMREAIGQTRENAYAHHIQRLMVTGNFALLAGIDPAEVDAWYLAVYADAYEWVEMPNVRGMALFADGGVVGSKPYAASGAYINRMSDYCAGCAYDVKQATGARGCPFNALYWDFIARHAERFAGNPRMAMPVRSWAKMAPDRQAALRGRAAELLTMLEAGSLL